MVPTPPHRGTKFGRFAPPSSAMSWRSTFSAPALGHGGRGDLAEHTVTFRGESGENFYSVLPLKLC